MISNGETVKCFASYPDILGIIRQSFGLPQKSNFSFRTTVLLSMPITIQKPSCYYHYDGFFLQNYGLRTPNEGINLRNLKFWADVADKICTANVYRQMTDELIFKSVISTQRYLYF